VLILRLGTGTPVCGSRTVCVGLGPVEVEDEFKRRQVSSPWCVVRGAWCVVRGAWSVVRGAWCVVRGVWCVVRGTWYVVRGLCSFHSFPPRSRVMIARPVEALATASDAK
jgi:hypothetical protein